MSSTEESFDEIERIAIVGMAGRFPGAENLEQFWENLRDGVEAISSFTDDELIASGVDPELLKSTNYVRARGVLSRPELFDASFFGFSPRDAAIIDPQLRAYLENCWETLENAGYDPEVYKGLIGVFGGMSAGQYVLYNLLPDRELVASVGAVQLRLFNDKDFLTPLVAYRLNLKGPTVTVQTACSTSLVAVHLACQSLLSYQCDLVLAGGVSVNIPPKSGYVPVEGVFAPDGHCRAFDAGAQGTVSGAGVGSVLLKRLSEAIADGDTIHAVIRGSAINNDGALRVGYSAPSVEGQSEVIAMAQAVAGVTPDSITYVEAHGTATPLGDPIEVAALSRVFRAQTEKKGFCGLGSVKTNIGHADAAAGIASLIKTVLALKHRQLPPTINFSQPNPEIDFANSPFFVNQDLREWRAEGGMRCAGVSSFAMGGTNAHVIVEEAPAPVSTSSSRPLQLLLLSAKTESALDTATERLADHLRQHPELDLADVAYTLQVGRRGFRHRRAIVGRDAEDVATALEQKDPRRLFTAEAGSGQASVAFMFSGLGNHYVGMGRELYQHEPFFREQIDYCCDLLKNDLGADLRDIVFAQSGEAGDEAETTRRGGRGLDLRQMLRGEERQDEASQRLNQTIYSQPALFVIEYALARLWMKWGIVPKALIGYSIGEYTAACLAGIFSLENALKLVAQRAQLIQKLESGSMLAVPLPVSEVEPLLGTRLELAAVNGPSVCVVSGETEAVDELSEKLTARGVAARRLATTHAFHSHMIAPIVEPFTTLLKKIKLNPPTVPLISNVTGDWLSAAQATDPSYWATHLCRPVLFGDGIERLWKNRSSVLLEVGPGQALGSWALQHPESQRVEGRVVLSSLRHSYDRQSDLAFLLSTLGRLWQAGVAVDWPQFHEGFQRRRVPLPTYPFERQRYWVEPRKQLATDPPAAGKPPLTKRSDIADWFYLPAWKQTAPVVTFTPEALGADAARYLIFLDKCGIGQRLARRLEAAGREVVTVKAGGNFRELGERSFAIAPDQAGDYDALFGKLRTRKLMPQVICHLWGVTPGDNEETPEAHLTNGFFSLLFLAQALGNRNTSDSLRLVAVSSGVQAVSGQEVLSPAKAAALGVCRVIPQEYGNVFCQCIDITTPGDSEIHADELSEQLLNELGAESTDTLIAYRGQRRWVQGYDAIRLEETGGKSLLKEGGVYLITGGLGGIGLTIADHLARTQHARLVLVGRSAMPEPAAWDAWLHEHGEDDTVSQKIRRLKSFEAYGAEVLPLSADVTSHAQMENVVAAALARFGRIDGVLHAAGVPPGGMIQMKTTEAASAVLAPKIQGTLVLDAVMRDERPDFIALCSSLNGVFGGFGLVDHCAANAFLDAFAEARATSTGTHVFSINWDGWLEVGQAANAALSAGLQGMLSASRQVKESNHPLLDEILVDEPDKQIYSTRISDTSHWPVAEHRLMGRGVMPGTGYLEMVRAAFTERAAGQTVVFKKVLFMSPLVIQDGEVREVRVTLTKNEDSYAFSVASGPASGNGQSWQEHARGHVSASAPAPADQHPLTETLARIDPQDVGSLEHTRQVQSDDGPEDDAPRFKEDDRNYGRRWQNLLKRVGLKDDEAIAELELPEEFVEDLKDYALHPALMDASVGFAQIAGEGFYLPLAYKSIKVHAPLTSKLFSYAKYPNGSATTSDILVCDLLLMDEHGNCLVEIEEYALRKITTAAALGGSSRTVDDATPAPRMDEQAVADPAGARPTALITEGILPREGAAVFDRLLGSGLRVSRFVVATRDLHELIRESRERTGINLLEQINKLQTRQQKHPRPNLPVAYVAPRNEIETRLTELWQEVVAVNEVGVHDSFFDLGGDSLLATLLIGRMGEAFDTDLSLRTIFEAPTPAEMAVAIVQQQAQQIDEQVLTDILGSIKNLSAEEVRGILDANQATH